MSSDRLHHRVEQLYDASQQVLDGCALDNGAIVAGNSTLDSYPATAESYLFFWGRDAAFQLQSQYVLDQQKAEDRAVRLARWLRRIPSFNDGKIIVKRYAPNGAPDVRYGEHYQPDQAGALMGAFDEIIPGPDTDIDYAVFTMAEGLAERWNGQSFGPTQDLWENRETGREHRDVFTYSLASVTGGMRRAIDRAKRRDGFTPLAVEHWEKSLSEMNSVLGSVGTDTYLRKIYPDPWQHDSDNTLDASLNALVYPFAPPDAKEQPNYTTIERTVLEIHRKLYQEDYGIKRYLGDSYDGIVRSHSAEAEAGTWPLLTFWHAIALKKIGKSEEAERVFYGEIAQLDALYRQGTLPENLIPEQVYLEPEKQGKGIVPLAWSHAMMVLAAKALDAID